ncbi:uncharacterized protein LOC121370971 [Gigantopelta aegis]|uniref:uncharacterized protein LOC121370971 n=1 Tax=Gigantopelta aegis TaxID=1735272 RepID=UPI001B88A01C|nr:uncharacterized protein LOC121370971 [Gigantopelta aegis]XP_041352474.1 uncharacterized protein LOC121370971 [Gigantopelta aegis]XP_041352475.1 uncharacterized protein LOC121370971 [Gigantopelta aegis]
MSNMSGRPVRLFDASDTCDERFRPGFMYEPDNPTILCNTAGKNNVVKTYENNNDNETVDTEYIRTLEVSQAPDTFPCGHVLCHHCLRRHMHRNYSRTLRCPVCYQIVTLNMSSMEPPLSPLSPTSPKSPGMIDDDAGPNVSLLSNFDEIVKKFNGVNHNLRRLKNESVSARSLGMTYTNTHCDLCNQNHGTLRVVQEMNQLQLSHERPSRCLAYYYRLAQGRIVTTFHSKVNSACICVPCSYKELRDTKKVPELEYITDNEADHEPQTCLAAVGKLIAKNTAPIMALKGKNVIEIEHTIRVRERADNFDFFDTTDRIESMVKQHERSLLKMATKQIKDTGKLYHVQETNEVELNLDETDV